MHYGDRVTYDGSNDVAVVVVRHVGEDACSYRIIISRNVPCDALVDTSFRRVRDVGLTTSSVGDPF